MSRRREWVEFFRHNLGEEERRALDEATRDLFLTTGARVAAFEEELAAYLGGGVTALGVSSCTAGLHLALLALGVGPGDEVVTTPQTFVATANAILYTGATPVFADVEPATGNLDPAAVEAALTPRTRAVLAVHLYGHMADVAALRRLCDRWGLALVEDAAHALEAQRNGARPGHLGDAACFSFYATKSITSGEGGALVMRDAALLARARRLSLHGLSATAAERHADPFRHPDMEELGYKYNMTNLQAALLRPQLRRASELQAAREARVRRYEEAFAGAPGLDWPRVAPGAVSAHHLATYWVSASERDATLAELARRRIGASVHYRPVHLTAYYRERFGHRPGALPAAEEIGERTLSLPLYPTLSEDHQQRVIDAMLELHAAGADGTA